jgi:hypothetical protein
MVPCMVSFKFHLLYFSFQWCLVLDVQMMEMGKQEANMGTRAVISTPNIDFQNGSFHSISK